MLTKEEFIIDMGRRFFPQLTKEQKQFLECIQRYGVCIQMTQEDKENKEIQELVRALSDMHKKGTIPSFHIVDA